MESTDRNSFMPFHCAILQGTLPIKQYMFVDICTDFPNQTIYFFWTLYRFSQWECIFWTYRFSQYIFVGICTDIPNQTMFLWTCVPIFPNNTFLWTLYFFPIKQYIFVDIFTNFPNQTIQLCWHLYRFSQSNNTFFGHVPIFPIRQYLVVDICIDFSS